MNNKSDKVKSKIVALGFRVTPIRGKMVETFASNDAPISAPDLINTFKVLRIKVNKTTIYRELDFLISKGLLKEIEFGDGKKRYELETGRHHHHIVCLICKKIEDVDLETDLSSEEKKLEKKTGFKIDSHSLEFFGYCKNCQ